jgi:hypothetical protein
MHQPHLFEIEQATATPTVLQLPIARFDHAPRRIVSTVRLTLSCHAGSRSPNTAASLLQSSLESGGRTARVGHSFVEIGSTFGTFRPCCAAAMNVAVANSCQVAAPVPAA